MFGQPSLPVQVAVSDYGVLSKQVLDPVSGKSTVVLVNVSKGTRIVSLSVGGYVDLVTGQSAYSVQTMEPYDVLLLQTGNDPGFSIGTIVQWGEPGGDSGIVTNGQDFTDLYSTYTVGNTVNPLVGPAYYPSNSGRSPEFNHAAKNAYNVKRVSDGGAGADYITTAKNDATYTAMVAWESFLAGHDKLESLEIETRINNSANTPSQFRWLIQKNGGAWYASAQTDTTNSYTLYSITDPGSLTRYDFTPHSGGTATVGSEAAIDMSGILALGYYATFQQPVSVLYRASETRYFKAVANSGTAVTGWDSFVSDYGLSGVATNDFDEDGKSDIYEYALGGNPTNAGEQGMPPSIAYHPDNTVSFYHLSVTSPVPGITYLPEWTTNLQTGPWTNIWILDTNYPAADPEFNQAEYQIDGGANEHLFYRLNISHP